MTRSLAPVQRRRLTLLAGLAAGVLAPGIARPQAAAWPSKPVTLITPSNPGGATDIASRQIAHYLSRELGQSVVVENKAGAAGVIAMQQLARSEPDGHTLGIASNSPLTTSPLLYKNPGYDPATSFASIGLFTKSAHALIVSGDSGITSLRDLVARGKAQPGSVVYSSSGVNGSIHLLSVLFTTHAGFEALHVPFKGGSDSAKALLGGEVTFAFDAITSILGLLKSGKLRALAVSGTARDAALPDVPTMAEAGYPAVYTDIFFGVIAPAKTPSPVLARLSAGVKKAAADPAFRDALLKSGSNPAYLGPDEFGQFIVAENRRWKAVIDKMGVVPQ